MKKSILTTALIASFSGSVFAKSSSEPLTDTITWTGTIPSIVVSNNSMSISSLTGSLDDAVLTFTRKDDGTLTYEPTVAESFEVLNAAGKPVDYNVTLNNVSATYSNSTSGEANKLAEGSVTVKRNSNAMTVGTAIASVTGESNFTLDFTNDALTVLSKQEDAKVIVAATLMVSPATSNL
ncbi:hypothetical protein [Vibrio sp. AND4]|uniref:hypothetical protein n=1 Tax=Vibrio sp. AND4 TaxID=314289 RepID=UPI00015F30F3|nr:hypothetical protein [Vibrio sp. AND4]EDP60394.1 hypothetical protein AND4_05739 [Vibrio sp. AND4]